MTYYDSIASGYDELHEQEQLKKLEIIKKYLDPKPEEKLLDVGCGSGVSTHFWQCKRYGIDPSENLLELARKKGAGEFVRSPAEHIPYEDHSFDYVISVTAIQNFEDISAGLLEMKRVGKERFIFSVLKSAKLELISKLVRTHFEVKEEIDAGVDVIFVI